MFDPTQVQLLQAMGYELWQRRDAAAPPRATSPAPAVAASAAAAPVSAAAPVETVPDRSPAVPAPVVAGAAAPPPRSLWSAVLAAAGLDEMAAERTGVRQATTGVAVAFRDDELWIDAQALRCDPRAKRTLWKTLRALRRAELGRRG
jgi:hypothetical protein